MNIIDTHIHIWDLKRSAYEWLKNAPELLNRSYSIDQIAEKRKEVGITGGVLVQADNCMEDTELMLETARNNEWIKGVVGWLPLMNPEETDRLLNEKFLKEKDFIGVRHLIHDEPDAAWLLQEPVIESLKILANNNVPYDLVGILPQHISTALKVAERVPELRMVFDHINQPPIQTGEKFGEWGRLMADAAKHNNFFIKISGLGGTAGKDKFTVDNIRPYVEFALNEFGVERCFTGGDWPVSLLAADYTTTWQFYNEVLSSLLSNEELEKVLFANAVEFYNLKIDQI